MAQHHSTGSETSPSYAPRSSRFCSEPPSVEDDVDVWRYAIVSCMPETTTTTGQWDMIQLIIKLVLNFTHVRDHFKQFSFGKIILYLHYCSTIVVNLCVLLCMNVGTEFMVKLHEQLTYFVAKKVSTDRLWQGLRIYLSGHEVIRLCFFGRVCKSAYSELVPSSEICRIVAESPLT